MKWLNKKGMEERVERGEGTRERDRGGEREKERDREGEGERERGFSMKVFDERKKDILKNTLTFVSF